jgi:hypothetical protein
MGAVQVPVAASRSDASMLAAKRLDGERDQSASAFPA